ncbi:MAG: lysophospholipid acyltransferase family protein [Desulfuromonadales bacterium]
MSLGKKLRPVKHRIEYPLFVALSILVRALPRTLALDLGRFLGGTILPRLRKVDRTAHHNIKNAFPDLSDKEARALLQENYRHIGINAIEMLRLSCLSRDADELNKIFSFEGLENLHEAYGEGKGVLALTGHVGGWEMGTFFLPRLGFKTAFIAKAMRNPFIDKRITDLRESNGGKVLMTRRGARRILKALDEKYIVCVLPDQHASPNRAVVVDFFGKPAYTTPVITDMAMKKGVPIVPIFCYRNPDNTYRVVIQKAIHLEKSREKSDVIRNTAQLTAIIEDAILKEPSQWFWVHRRWRVPR